MEKKISKEIRVVSKYISRYINELTKDEGLMELTGVQGLVVSFIYEHNGKDIFQKDIEKEFNIRRSSATGLLQSLEAKGYLYREEVSYDARLKKLVLTEKSLLLHKKINNNIDVIEKKMLQGLSEKEIIDFCNLINKVKDNLGKE